MRRSFEKKLKKKRDKIGEKYGFEEKIVF